MRITIASSIKSTLPESVIAKEYLKLVEECFRSADKSLTRTLMAKFTTMKYDGSLSMQQHIIDMTNITARLTTLGMKDDDSFLVQFIMNSLPPEYVKGPNSSFLFLTRGTLQALLRIQKKTNLSFRLNIFKSESLERTHLYSYVFH